MSVSNCCVWSQLSWEGDVLTVAICQCMYSTPLPWFKVQRLSWPFPPPRSPCNSAWGLSERMSIHMSMWTRKPFWGVGTLMTWRNYTTETMSPLVYNKFTYITQTPKPSFHQCPMSTYASTSYQPYNGNEWCCVQHNVLKDRFFSPFLNGTSPYWRHRNPEVSWWRKRKLC